MVRIDVASRGRGVRANVIASTRMAARIPNAVARTPRRRHRAGRFRRRRTAWPPLPGRADAPGRSCRGGWTLDEAAARYNAHAAADPHGRASMRGARLGEHENWPFGGRKPSLTALGVLAEVYQVAVPDLIDLHDRENFSPKELLLLSKTTSQPRPATITAPGPAAAAPPVPRLPGSLIRPPGGPAPGPAPATPPYGEPDFAYCQIQGIEPRPNGTAILREVMMAAHEGSDHAERAERRDIGEMTLEQIRADVIRLSHEYMTEAPWPLFQEMRRVRARIHAALDRKLWPRDQTELYFLLAVLNTLMSVAAKNLGSLQAADELARSGWAFAHMIDNRPMMSRLQIDLADLAYDIQPRRSRECAQRGLEYLRKGPNGALLYLIFARASARIGDRDEARRAIADAGEAREGEYHDDLLDIGGEFDFSHASQHYFAGSALLELPGAEAEAISELEQAVEMYGNGPLEGETHRYTLEAKARTNLAAAWLRAGQLDAAVTTLASVLSLPISKRTADLPEKFGDVRKALAAPRYQGSAGAVDLDEHVEEFCAETIAGDLRGLVAAASR